MPPARLGRWTLGLYNSYDPNHFHEAMRRAVARAAPLCQSFEMNLAPIGFPFHAYRDKSGAAPDRETPERLAALIAESTSIGEGGEYLQALAQSGRFTPVPFPQKGFPPQLGTPVLATRQADPKKRIDLREIAFHTRTGQSYLFIIGLGPRGVPKELHEMAHHHLELTGQGLSLETATAMGVLAGRLFEALDWAVRPASPPLTSDAYVEDRGRVLLIRRAREPFKGQWALPGGFVDTGEALEDSVLRELREETGLEGVVRRLVGVYSRAGRDPRGPTVSAVYQIDCPDPKPVPGDDAAEARFWPLDALPPLAFDHAQVIADAQRRP